MSDRADETATEETGSHVVSSSIEKGKRKLLDAARRDLSEKELATPAGQQFMIETIDRLEREVSLLSDYRNKFYENDKALAVKTKEKDDAVTGSILTSALLAIGSAGVGAAPSYITLTDLSKVSTFGWIFLVLSALLLVTAVTAQVRKWI